MAFRYVATRLQNGTYRSQQSPLLMTSLIAVLTAFATNTVFGVAVVVAESETGGLRLDLPLRTPVVGSLNRSVAPSEGFDEQTGSGIDRRRNVIRGESEAAVITRLPVMKVSLRVHFSLAGVYRAR